MKHWKEVEDLAWNVIGRSGSVIGKTYINHGIKIQYIFETGDVTLYDTNPNKFIKLNKYWHSQFEKLGFNEASILFNVEKHNGKTRLGKIYQEKLNKLWKEKHTGNS